MKQGKLLAFDGYVQVATAAENDLYPRHYLE
jgi:hypothetical protein